MRSPLHTFTVLCLALFTFGCEKTTVDLHEVPVSNSDFTTNLIANHARPGATQIDGIGTFAEATDCDLTSEGADYALSLAGDLEGCLFVFVESFECSPSGTYRESGKEYFVGTYNGESGTFWTSYKFSAKYEGCGPDGFFTGAEIFGRCQHPIIRDSGTGVFAGVSGRLDFKDDVETATFPYRGHLRY